METMKERYKKPMSGPTIFCSLLINGGLTFMFFYFLYDIEKGQACYANTDSSINDGSPIYSDLLNFTIDVAYNFKILLIIYASIYAIEIARLFFTVMYENAKVGFFGLFANLLKLNGLLMLAAWIMMMVYRLRHSGWVCSGYYYEGDDSLNWYLVKRGRLFLALILVSWILIGLMIIVGIFFCICGSRT